MTRIGIVGVGPRGLTILERIVANERAHKSTDIEVYLFDPNHPGVGCHDPEQSDYLLVNTVAGQITQFCDASVVGAGPLLRGPSFYEWLQDERCHKQGASHQVAAVSSDAYYSRGLFGRYLHWVYRYLCGLAPAHVKIFFIKSEVTRAARITGGSWLLQTNDAAFQVEYLFLTTGHTKAKTEANAAKPSRSGRQTVVIGDPYPLAKKLARITSDMTVAIEGMGLTTFDVLAELTLGRGGRFVVSAISGQTTYLASGREPRIVAFSRSGLPLTVRAVNQKGVSLQYRPRFLFAEKLRTLRSTRKLDFVIDVLPLLIADMEYAYYEAYWKKKHDPLSAMLFCNQFVCADEHERQALIAQYVPPSERFSWARLIAPIPAEALASLETYRRWLSGHLRADLQEARKGNLDSPLKAASDVLRDLRDTLRVAIDFGGLTEASHRWLLSEFVPIMNRVAVGPPASRIAEMLALMDAGVLEAGLGPNTRCEIPRQGGLMRVAGQWPQHTYLVDVLIKARVSLHSPEDDASPMLRGLLEAGDLRLFRNGDFHPGGIEVDRNFNWVSKNGDPIGNAWALGIPTEGVKFYTFVVPRSGVNSTALVDAGRAVSKMLSMNSGRAPAPAVLRSHAGNLPTEEHASAFASLNGVLS